MLQSDPDKGYVVIYELPSNGEADQVGKDFVVLPRLGDRARSSTRATTQFVVRRVG